MTYSQLHLPTFILLAQSRAAEPQESSPYPQWSVWYGQCWQWTQILHINRTSRIKQQQESRIGVIAAGTHLTSISQNVHLWNGSTASHFQAWFCAVSCPKAWTRTADRAGSPQRTCPALSLHQNSWGNEVEAQVPGCAPEHQFRQPYLDVNGVFRTTLVFTHRQ